MIPDEYIGVNPYGLESKMSRIIITENLCLPLATINHTDTYTLTIWIKSNSNKTIELYYGSNVEYFDVTTEWKRFEFIFDPSTNDEVGLELSVGTYFIWHAKLEKGNKPTDWTPAPEDVKREAETYTDSKFSITDEKIESEVRRVNELNQKMTKFEQDSEGFTWNIDETAIVSSDTQYYKSTSPTECVGGSWSTNKPVWSVGTYIWMRTRNKNGAGEYTYGAEVCVTDDVRIGGENLLSDTDVPSMTKIAGPGDKYLSDAANSTYSNGRFVSISDPPDPYFTHAYELECTTASSIPTAGRSLCFYSGKKVPMDNEETYTMSMYARKVSGDGKIRFLVGYDKYPNYNNYIEVTSEWKRYSYTFVYRNLDFHKNESTYGGARCYFGASCAVVGKVQICGFKLEKGNKVSDWRPSSNDVRYATDEASKTATNYMKFNSDGLTIGNMMESTLGKNVLIDSDSVDIRNGSQVLARYGENIVLRHKDKDVFSIKDSTFVDEVIQDGRMLDYPGCEWSDVEYTYVYVSSGDDGGSIKISSKVLTADTIYVWHINTVDRYAVFTIPVTVTMTKMMWQSSKPAFIKFTFSGFEEVEIPCAYFDASAVTNTVIKGSMWIDNVGDVNGNVKCIPPFGIGTVGGQHLAIDNNEISSKQSDTMPDDLYLNSEGGAVSINNNFVTAFKFENGCLFTRKRIESEFNNYYSDWRAVLDLRNYNTKLRSFSDLLLWSDYGDVINERSSFVVGNGSSYFGTNTSGERRNNLQPCNSNNNCVIGYGSYEKNEGATNIYGNKLNIVSNDDYIKFNNRYLGSQRILWSTSNGLYMNKSQSITFVESTDRCSNGIILVFSDYNNTDNKAKDYGYESFFVPRIAVKTHSGKAMLFSGADVINLVSWSKLLYISETGIKGDGDNSASGDSFDNRTKVLRAVYGV